MEDEITIYDQLNNVRMFILLETAPFSNTYNPLVMNKKMYNEISQFIFDRFSVKDPGHACINPECDGQSMQVDHRDIALPDMPEKHDHE